ncbi:hypothetical protein [Streptomyces sp. SID12488]|uniref:hypothetical protein n=1 Tax=Streptomyces sp. SID12488 TaxID=2706040 RepID=UPI0013DB50F8|nr:hypothetical protein [Streptomyces sp. SID12488]NEA64073.1 hypothetical protein [Streptomyces sp. SID12488]
MTGTGASFLLRSTRGRRPTVRRPLPDGSCLTTICAGRYQAGRGYGRLEVRIIEACMTIELADCTRRTELWRLMSSLLDAESYPVHELITLYHRTWQAETCYFSLRSTVLDWRVLRSRTTWSRCSRACRRKHVSLIVLLNAAADQIVAARGIAPVGPVGLVGAIGRVALAGPGASA